MIEPAHQRLSIAAQCRLLSISRSSYYYAPVPESEETLALMRVIDAAFLDMPWYGSRQMVRHLRRGGYDVGRRRVRRLMGKMGLSPIYQRPRTSDPHPQHRIYPYLLRKLEIVRPNHVWCADVTYIPMRRGFLYLVAVMALRQAQEGDPQGLGLAPVEHDGCGLLRGGFGGSAGALRSSRDLQYGSG
jgi:putative transposase